MQLFSFLAPLILVLSASASPTPGGHPDIQPIRPQPIQPIQPIFVPSPAPVNVQPLVVRCVRRCFRRRIIGNRLRRCVRRCALLVPGGRVSPFAKRAVATNSCSDDAEDDATTDDKTDDSTDDAATDDKTDDSTDDATTDDKTDDSTSE